MFSSDDLSLLSHPEQWQIVSSLFPPDIRYNRSTRMSRWAEDHIHIHDHSIEIIMALQGTMHYGLQGKFYQMNPGSIVLINKQETHVYPYPPFTPDCDHLYLNLVCGEVFYRTYSVRKGLEQKTRPSKRISEFPHLGILTEKNIHHLQHAQYLPDALKRAKLLSTIALLITQVAEEYLGDRETGDSTTDIAKMIGILQKHIFSTHGKNIDLNQLARITGYSKYHLLRLFKTHTGLTIHQYIDRARIHRFNEGCQQGISQKQLGYELGFSSPQSFSRWVRNYKKKSSS